MEWIIVLAFLLMLVGLTGVVFPFVPGVPLAWVGLFAYAYKTGFTEVPPLALWIFGGLTLLTFVIDFIGPVLAARMKHASHYAVQGAFWGSVLGVVLMGPVGIFIGPLLGAFLGELAAGRHPRQALQATLGAMAGFLIGSAIKIIIVLSMMIYLAVVLLF